MGQNGYGVETNGTVCAAPNCWAPEQLASRKNVPGTCVQQPVVQKVSGRCPEIVRKVPTIGKQKNVRGTLCQNLDTRIKGSVDTRIKGSEDTRDPWIQRSRDPWLQRSRDPCIQGSRDPWIQGSRVLWIPLPSRNSTLGPPRNSQTITDDFESARNFGPLAFGLGSLIYQQELKDAPTKTVSGCGSASH